MRRERHGRTGEMQPQAKECRELPDARRGQKGALCGLQRYYGPTGVLISDFRPPELFHTSAVPGTQAVVPEYSGPGKPTQ